MWSILYAEIYIGSIKQHKFNTFEEAFKYIKENNGYANKQFNIELRDVYLLTPNHEMILLYPSDISDDPAISTQQRLRIQNDS